MKPAKLKQLVDKAEATILARGLAAFRLEQLMGMLGVKRPVASKVVTALKKRSFLHANDDNWFQDVCFRGWRLFVLKSEPRRPAMETQHERRGTRRTRLAGRT